MRARIDANDGDIKLRVDIGMVTRGLTKNENGELLRECVRNITKSFEFLPFSDFGIDNIETKLSPKKK